MLIGAVIEPKASAPPLWVMNPSSTVRPARLCVPETVTVYKPVALVPAEKAATLPAVQVVGTPRPVESVFQWVVVALQTPVGVELPAPARLMTSISQYLICASTAVAPVAMITGKAISAAQNRIGSESRSLQATSAAC